MLQFIPLIGGLVKTAGGLFKSWQDRKLVKSQGKIEIEKARVEGAIKREQTLAEADINYNAIAAEGMAASWKDELITIVFMTILVCAFLPWTQPYVKEGFIFLQLYTPEWFQWCVLGIVTASFGLKGWKMIKN